MPKKNYIESDAIQFEPGEHGDFSVTLRTSMGRRITVTNAGSASEPIVEGDPELVGLPSISKALWLAAIAQLGADELAVKLEDVDEEAKAAVVFDGDFLRVEIQKSRIKDAVKAASKEYEKTLKELADQASKGAKTATRLGDLVNSLDGVEVEGWCSQCLCKSKHKKVMGKPLYICDNCGTATAKCSVIKCEHFAAADLGPVPVPVFCAEHTHRVPNFDRLEHRISDLTQWRELREFRAMNVTRAATLSAGAVAGLAVCATGGFALAPMVGSAVGTTFLGLTGAAATNAGLAALGFGSLAAGGLGMAGGSMVVAAAGGLLGSAFGIQALNSYVSEDDSFDIRRVRAGSGIPVLIARGFTTEKDPDWRAEVMAVEAAYPDSSIYLVEWGSKELRELIAFLNPGLGVTGGAAFKVLVKRASKKLARQATPIGTALGTIGLLTNPWHTAVNRANKTAMTLAAILQRSDVDSVVLVGHSLGGRVMLNLATALAGTERDKQQVHVAAMHLLGAAVGQDKQRNEIGESIAGVVHNYYSNKDKVLGRLYPAAMLGNKPIGFLGLDAPFATNHDVSEDVSSHSDYYKKVKLVVDDGAA